MREYNVTEGPFQTEYECIHRMREISDFLLKWHSKKEVSFSTKLKETSNWFLDYTIYDRA